jgi:hypothetical protein
MEDCTPDADWDCRANFNRHNVNVTGFGDLTS